MPSVKLAPWYFNLVSILRSVSLLLAAHLHCHLSFPFSLFKEHVGQPFLLNDKYQKYKLLQLPSISQKFVQSTPPLKPLPPYRQTGKIDRCHENILKPYFLLFLRERRNIRTSATLWQVNITTAPHSIQQIQPLLVCITLRFSSHHEHIKYI